MTTPRIVAPAAIASIAASHVVAGVVDRTRPLCSYPASAHYIGTSGTDEAQNFRCQAP
jgi:feruloyl esterase